MSLEEHRGALIDSIGPHVTRDVLYSGKYGKIVLEVSRFDRLQGPAFVFRTTRPDHSTSEEGSLREALMFLEVPYEDGTLPPRA